MNYKENFSNVLHWNYRGFTEFPLKSLQGEEADITDIYLKENLISRIPSDIGKLYNLESLYLSGNDITELPREISKLICLKCLDVSGNRLRCVPEEIGELKNLKFLILDENELQRLPLRIAELRSLRYLSVCDNQLQWLAQRPVYNYYHCELRFWRNPTLKVIPYSLWYHMYRGQTACVNIKSLQIGNSKDDIPKGRCILRVPATKENVHINFPPRANSVIVNFNPVPASLLELCKRTFYAIISDAAKRIPHAYHSIYADKVYNNINNLEESFNAVDINKNVLKSKENSLNRGIYERFLNLRKQYYVPYDIINEYFDYLPTFIKNDLICGPISKCENVGCKKPIFDYAYYEFCLEKIILADDDTTDVILSATFCSKSCADSWKPGKCIVPWNLITYQ